MHCGVVGEGGCGSAHPPKPFIYFLLENYSRGTWELHMFGFRKKQEQDDFKGVNFKITPKVYEHTPDIVRLQQKESHLYFAYHLVNNGHSGFLDSGMTADPFQLWKGRHGDNVYPVATHQIPQMRRLPCLPVRGRLLLLSTEELIQMDEWTQNGVQFTRKTVEIRIPRELETHERDRAIRDGGDIFPAYHRRNSKVCMPTGGLVKASIHIGRSEFFADKLDGGFTFSQVKPFDDFSRYLQFTVRDFDG